MVHRCGQKPSGEEVSFSSRYSRITDRLNSIPLHDRLAVRGLEEHVRITLIIPRIISFILFTVLLSHMYFFRRLSDSQFMSWIHDLEE